MPLDNEKKNNDVSTSNTTKEKWKTVLFKRKDKLPNFIEIDQKYHSLTSEWRRMLTYKDKFYLKKLYPKAKLWSVLEKAVAEVYKQELGVIFKESEIFYMILTDEQKIQFKVDLKNELTGKIRIFNQLEKQFFWTEYQIVYEDGFFWKKPILKYNEYVKFEKSLDVFDPKTQMIKVAFRKNAIKRANRFNEIYIKQLDESDNVKEDKEK